MIGRRYLLLGIIVAAAPCSARADVEMALRLPAGVTGRVDVVRLQWSLADRRWIAQDISERVVVQQMIAVPVSRDSDTVLMMTARGHGGYLLAGPLQRPGSAGVVDVDATWRRTLRGGTSARADARIDWLSASHAGAGTWPGCAVGVDRTWECLGVPFAEPGVIAIAAQWGVEFALAPGGGPRGGYQEVATTSAAWGRLVVTRRVYGSVSAAFAVTVTARRVELPRARAKALRLHVVPESRLRTYPLTADTFWVAARDDVEGAWLDIAAADGAARVEAIHLREQPETLPVHIELGRSREIAGRVALADGRPAGGATVSVFRLAPATPVASPRQRQRRIFVLEQRTDDEGGFECTGLLPEALELLVLHPQHGRAIRGVDSAATRVDVVLRSPPRVIGRVLRHGVPAEGVPVAFVPSLATFADAADVTSVIGGDTTTDADGGFIVAVAEEGAGEVRVGDSAHGVRRFPLAPADALPPTTDLGVIELQSSRPVLTFMLDGASGCDLLLSGPVGRTGLQIVRARADVSGAFPASVPESGRWLLSAVCGSAERRVEPSFVDVDSGAAHRTVVLSWHP